MIQVNKNNTVDARLLYEIIGVKTRFNDWINNCIDFCDFKEGKDFYYFLSKSTGGRPAKQYQLTLDSAKECCIIAGTKKAKELRKWLISLSNKYEVGELYTTQQINFLLELVPVMGLFSVQNHAKNMHYKYHNNKYDWWEYRANILGFGTLQLKNEIEKLNRKYKSQRQALMHIDKFELIRVGIIDLFVSLGKSPEYASNVADLCKNMAVKMNVDILDDSIHKNTIKFPKKHNKTLEKEIKENHLKLQ